MAGRVSQVFVASATSKGLVSALQKLLPAVDLVQVDLNDKGQLKSEDKETIEQNAEVLLCDPPVIHEVLYSAQKLQWIQSTWAGVDSVLKCIDRNKPLPSFLVSRTGRAYAPLMAEYVLAYIIAQERGFIQMYQSQQNKTWDNSKFREYRALSDLTIGILGVGDIGKEVAKTCKSMDMTVLGVCKNTPTETNKCPHVDNYRSISELPELLQSCDYVCNILPSTEETVNLLSNGVLQHCQSKKSIFINIGRGSVISEESLLHALRNKWLGGAVLDVFNTEPLPKDSPLWSEPNVIITPHVSGCSSPKPVAESFASNFNLFEDNKPLDFLVNYSRGY